MCVRNVSFRYPGAEKYALQNVSFTIGAGQLCVSTTSFVIHFLTMILDHCRGERLWKKHSLETHFPHLRPYGGHYLY
jgi:energy-coupling factor transporter ATP-binding protein EcfA2